MSGRWGDRVGNLVFATPCAVLLTIITLAMIPCQAFAQDKVRSYVDIVTLPLVDPWLTRPPQLDKYPMVPGDIREDPCHNTYDLALPMPLDTAIDLALCHNPQIKGAWSGIKVQAAAVGEARAAYLPTVVGSLSRSNDQTNYPNGSYPNTSTTSNTAYGNLVWRLFDFGGRDANRRSANALLKAALANNDAVLQKTLTSVIAAYFDAQTTQASWQAKKTNEALAKQTLATARKREEHGAGSVTDTMQAATALAKTSLEKSRALGAYERALSVLIYSLGINPGSRLLLADDVADKSKAISKDLNGWIEEAQRLHPAIVAAREQLESSKERVTAVRSEGLPSIDFTGNFFQNGRPNQGLSLVKTEETLVGFTLNIPLFDGFARTYKVRGAQAQVEQKEAELEDTEHQILMEVVKAYADSKSALENLAASQLLFESANTTLTSVQKKFDHGAADILEILSTQTALSEAQTERIRCLAEWRSAKLRLFANAGVLGWVRR